MVEAVEAFEELAGSGRAEDAVTGDCAEDPGVILLAVAIASIVHCGTLC